MLNNSDRANTVLNVPSPVIQKLSYHNKCVHCHRIFSVFCRPIECTKCHAMVCEKCSVVTEVDHENNSSIDDTADANSQVKLCLVCNKKVISK